MRRRTNHAANCFRAHGVSRGDRIAILLTQSPQTAIAHIAAFKIGAISVPLFNLFGAEALEFRLKNSGASLLVTDADGATKISSIAHKLPVLNTMLATERPNRSSLGFKGFEAAIEVESEHFTPVVTRSDDPAILIYTSGTTGKPKGALHAHRVLPGHLPGVEMSHGGSIEKDDVFWTPAD